MPGVPKSDRRPVWRRRLFFISSVEDSVLERSAALESLCFGIGFGIGEEEGDQEERQGSGEGGRNIVVHYLSNDITVCSSYIFLI